MSMAKLLIFRALKRTPDWSGVIGPKSHCLYRPIRAAVFTKTRRRSHDLRRVIIWILSAVKAGLAKKLRPPIENLAASRFDDRHDISQRVRGYL